MELELNRNVASSIIVHPIDQDFRCVICNQIMFEPVRDMCPSKPHSFCRPCILNWIKQQSTCPMSRQVLRASDLSPNIELLNQLNEIETKCRNHDRECNWTGPARTLSDHLRICPKRVDVFKAAEFFHPLSKGGIIYEALNRSIVRKNTFELAVIIMDFTRQTTLFGTTKSFNSLAALQLVFRTKNSPNNYYHFSPGIGVASLNHPGNVDKREVFHIAPGDRITAVVCYRGTKFFPLIGFSTVENPIVTLFGYEELAKYPQRIEFGPRAQIIGVYGEVSWVIGSFGFVIAETFDD